MNLPKPPQYVPAGPMLNRLVATLICGNTSGLPDDTYPPFSADFELAFQAVDVFLGENGDAKLSFDYPVPEVWIKRNAEGSHSEWIPVAFTVGDTLPHALCLALVKAIGHEDEIIVPAAAAS